MKTFLLLHLLSLHVLAVPMEQTISGKVEKTPGCSEKVMVWLSLDKDNYKERLLLLHTEVPLGGTFRFHVKPGDYQVRASDQVGCEYMQRLTVKGEDPALKIRMVKK